MKYQTLFTSLFCLLLASCWPSDPTKVTDKAQWVSSMSRTIEQLNPDIAALTYEQWRELLDSGLSIVLVDVRTPAERAVSILPGAIDESMLTQRKEGDRELWLFYCTNGERSVARAREALKLGAHRVAYFKGGLLALAHAGQEFEHQGLPTREVHAFSKAWNFFPEDYHVQLP